MDDTFQTDFITEEGLKSLETLDIPTHSFVVVIHSGSREQSRRDRPWRGYVEHVQSRERIYFQECERLIEFLSAHCFLDISHPAAERKQWKVFCQRMLRLTTAWFDRRIWLTVFVGTDLANHLLQIEV